MYNNLYGKVSSKVVRAFWEHWEDSWSSGLFYALSLQSLEGNVL